MKAGFEPKCILKMLFLLLSVIPKIHIKHACYNLNYHTLIKTSFSGSTKNQVIANQLVKFVQSALTIKAPTEMYKKGS